MGEGEEETREGEQKDCRPGWDVEVRRDWEGEEDGVELLLTAPLPLLLMMDLALVLASP